MKKILVLVFLLAAAAGAALYFSRLSGPVAGEYYADYLPVETLVTVSVIDLKGLSESFPASSLGKFFAKPTIHGIISELGMPSRVVDSYDEMYDGLAGVMTNPAFRQVFGDDAVAALLPPDSLRLRSDPELELRKSVLVFGTSSVSGPLESFARLVMSSSVGKVTVDGLEVTRIDLDDNEVIYGYADKGVLILAYEPANIARAVKRKQSGGGLQEAAFFMAAKDFWSGSAAGREYAQCYVNIAGVRDLLAASGEEKAERAAEYLQGFKGIGSIVVDQQAELRILSRMEYDFDSLNELVKDQYKAVSKENFSLDLLTGETLIYYWISLFDKEYFKELVSAADEEEYRQVNARIQRELGLSLDEIIAAVGPQSGLVVNDIVNAGLFPLPKVILFLQVRDHDVALQMVDSLRKDIAARGFATEQSREVNGRTIYSWSLLPGEATQPALVLTDNMLYFANGETILSSLVGEDRSPNTLPADMTETLGSELVKSVEDSNYSTFVMRPAKLARKVEGAAEWLAGMVEATRGVSAVQLQQEILKLMRSIDVVTATSNIQKDHAVSSLVFKRAAASVEDKK